MITCDYYFYNGKKINIIHNQFYKKLFRKNYEKIERVEINTFGYSLLLILNKLFKEEENLRYCAFIDIIRPSHFDNIMKSILTGVGFLLKKTRSIFYKNWKMI